jgi:hypothetical protein
MIDELGSFGHSGRTISDLRYDTVSIGPACQFIANSAAMLYNKATFGIRRGLASNGEEYRSRVYRASEIHSLNVQSRRCRLFQVWTTVAGNQCPRLVKACHHLLPLLTKLHIPTTFTQLGSCGKDEVETVGQLLKNNHGARQQSTLAVHLRPDILANAGPPNFSFRDQRGHLLNVMESLL